MFSFEIAFSWLLVLLMVLPIIIVVVPILAFIIYTLITYFRKL